VFTVLAAAVVGHGVLFAAIWLDWLHWPAPSAPEAKSDAHPTAAATPERRAAAGSSAATSATDVTDPGLRDLVKASIHRVATTSPAERHAELRRRLHALDSINPESVDRIAERLERAFGVSGSSASGTATQAAVRSADRRFEPSTSRISGMSERSDAGVVVTMTDAQGRELEVELASDEFSKGDRMLLELYERAQASPALARLLDAASKLAAEQAPPRVTGASAAQDKQAP